MKFRFVILFFSIVCLISIKGFAQCKQRFVYECALQSAGQIFLKEFNTKFSNGKVQVHKVMLNKGYLYSLQLCNPSDSQYEQTYQAAQTGIDVNSMLSLYDSNNNIVATTATNPKFNFFCPKTDVYYIHIMPLCPKTTCAVGILSVVTKR